MSGWTNVTIEPGPSVPEPSANPRSATEQVYDYLDSEYGPKSVLHLYYCLRILQALYPDRGRLIDTTNKFVGRIR